MTNNYLRRYEAGDYAVWNEILESAQSVVASPEHFAEATAVAKAIMSRVSQNIITVRKTLTKAGAELTPTGEPLTDKDLSIFTNRFGPMPLSLDVFYKTIGSASLAPIEYDYGPNKLEDRDGIEILVLDPFVIEPANIFGWALDEYDAEFTEDEEEENPFGLLLCADYLHKADISGGEPYKIYLPASTPEDKLDPTVETDEYSMPFVEYLRYCFKWGGFPGLAVLEQNDEEIDLNRQMPFASVDGNWREAAERLLEELRTGLIPF